MATSLIAIRTFSSADEIRQLPNFVENNPLTKATYKQLVGDYHFEKEELHCCFEKENKNLCLHRHKNGWIIQLADGTVTLLGNDCASAQFGLESRLIADRSRYNNEKRRQERIRDIAQFLSEKETRLAQLYTLHQDLETLRARVKTYCADFGPGTLKQLREFTRRSTQEVQVKAVKFREYEDDNGRPKTERSSFTMTLGTLDGLKVLRSDAFYRLYEAMKDVAMAYDEALTLGDMPRSSVVDSLAARLGDDKRIVREGQQLLEFEQPFMANDRQLFLYIIHDSAELLDMAVSIMNAAGQPGGRKKAREWLSNHYKTLAESLSVDKIEVL